MTMYADEAILVDTAFIVAATVGEGEGLHDGKYWIQILLHVGGKPRYVGADYTSQAARDTAFAALRALVTAETGVGEKDV